MIYWCFVNSVKQYIKKLILSNIVREYRWRLHTTHVKKYFVYKRSLVIHHTYTEIGSQNFYVETFPFRFRYLYATSREFYFSTVPSKRDMHASPEIATSRRTKYFVVFTSKSCRETIKDATNFGNTCAERTSFCRIRFRPRALLFKRKKKEI